MKYVSFVGGAATAILQYFQPLGDTWIGHVKWASDNLVVSAYIGAAIGALLFFAGPRFPSWLRFLVLAVVAVGFVAGLATSIYWSINITSVAAYADQLFYRDTVWKLAHLFCAMCLTVVVFCLSFFAKE